WTFNLCGGAPIGGGPAPTITNPSLYNTTVSNLGAGTYGLTWTITNGACSSSDDVLILISDDAPSTADAGENTDVCGDSFYTMTAETPTVGSGSWTQISGPNTATIVSIASPTTNITGLITGEYTFRWTVTGGNFCPPSSDDVIINVYRNADAGDDQEYCEAISSVNLTGTTGSGGTWTQVGTTPNEATITATSSNTSTASGLIPGVYTFQYAITAISGSCESTDEMTVTLLGPPSTAAAGTDQTLCEESVFSLDAETPDSGIGTWSKLFGPTVSGEGFSNENDPDATFEPVDYGVYVFQWTVANGDCSNADQVRIENFQNPSTADAGEDQTLVCETEITMAANDPEVGTGVWSLVSKTGDAPDPTIVSPILYNTPITGMGPQSSGDEGVYVFKWSIGNGPVCDTAENEVTITIYQTPTPAEAGDDQSLCEQNIVTLDATPISVGDGTWSQVSPVVTSEIISVPSQYNTTVSGLVAGETYIFEWLTETEFCSSSDQVTITNYEEPTVADASATETQLCLYEPMLLDANTPTVGTGVWTQTGGDPVLILYPTQAHTPVVGAFDGTYEFTWTISNGSCTPSSDAVTVVINEIPTQALAGPDQILCNISTATTSATMTGNEPFAPVTGIWTIVSKPSGAADPTFAPDNTAFDAEVSGLVPVEPAIDELKWTHTTGGAFCEKSDNMKLYIWEGPTAADAGNDQTVCDETTFTMQANAAVIGDGEWTRVD
ncbi:MAG: hypothetical protein C0594_17255, partial [Marinilabiliales bacterium]